MGYQFLINKIYFNNDKAEPWDEDFKDFYRKKVAELEKYNKEKTSLEYIKSLGAIGSEIQVLFNLVQPGLNPFKMSDIKTFNQEIYKKMFNVQNASVALELAQFLYDRSQDLFGQVKFSPACKAINDMVNYGELQKQLRNIIQKANESNEQMVTQLSNALPNILSTSFQGGNIQIIGVTQENKTNKNNQIIYIPRGWHIPTKYFDLILKRDIVGGMGKNIAIKDVFDFKMTEVFYKECANYLYEGYVSILCDSKNPFWTTPMEFHGHQTTTPKYTLQHVNELKKFFNRSRPQIVDAILSGLKSYNFTIYLDKFAKGFLGEFLAEATFKTITNKVIQIGNNAEYQKLNKKNDKGEQVIGGQTPSDLIFDLQDDNGKNRKIRVQVKQWRDSGLSIGKDPTNSGFGAGSLSYLPEGKNTDRFYSMEKDKNILGTIRFLGANAYVAQKLGLDPLRGEDFTHLYLGAINIENYYDYVMQEVNGNDLYIFRGRLVPGCYLLMRLFDYIKQLDTGSKLKPLNPKIDLIIDTSKEATVQKGREQIFKDAHNVKGYNNDIRNIIPQDSKVNFSAAIHSINIKVIIEKIFNF